MITENARVVLQDCRDAVKAIKTDAIYLSHRFRWVTAVVLLRAVGHVLRSIDRQENPLARDLIDEAWGELKRSRPNPMIFWEFIDRERNNIVKEYRFRIQTAVILQAPLYDAHTGQRVSPEGIEPSTSYHYVIKDGPFDGRPQVEVLQEAIDFWQTYLDMLDLRAATLNENAQD